MDRSGHYPNVMITAVDTGDYGNYVGQNFETFNHIKNRKALERDHDFQKEMHDAIQSI